MGGGRVDPGDEREDRAEAAKAYAAQRASEPPAAPPGALPEGWDWNLVPGNTMEEKLAHLRGMADAMASLHPEAAPLYQQALQGAQAAAPAPAAAPVSGPMAKAANFVATTVPGYKLSREEADHFVVKDGEGEFRVAKNGLKPDLVTHIKGMASGGEVNAPDAGYQQSFFVPQADPVQFTPGGQLPGAAYDPWTQIRPGSMADDFMRALSDGTRPGSPAAAMMGGLGYTPAPAPLPEATPTPQEQASQQMPQMATGMPGQLTRSDLPQERPQAQARNAPGGAQRPAGPSEMDKATGQTQAGINAQADAERQLATQQTAAWDQYAAERASQQAQMQQSVLEHNAKGAQLYQDVLNSNIDPGKLWASADVGQRIGAGIAMLFGAVGAMANGGKNMVVEQLDRYIDRDVDAQKANLGKKQSLLQNHLQAGRDMLSAQQLAKADLYDGLRAQLERNAASIGGAAAAAKAQVLSGEMAQKAVLLRQNAEMQAMQMRLAGQGMAIQRAQLEAQQKAAEQQAKLMQTIMGAPRTPGGGIQLPTGATEALPKEMRERRVLLPDGSTAFAKDPTEAKDLSTGFQYITAAKRKLQRYRTLLDSGHPVVSPSDRAQAKSLRADIMLALKDAAKLGAVSGWDADQLESLIPNITSATTLDSTLTAGLDAFGSSLDDQVMARISSLGGLQ